MSTKELLDTYGGEFDHHDPAPKSVVCRLCGGDCQQTRALDRTLCDVCDDYDAKCHARQQTLQTN